jgi:hypothetical protein
MGLAGAYGPPVPPTAYARPANGAVYPPPMSYGMPGAVWPGGYAAPNPYSYSR